MKQCSKIFFLLTFIFLSTLFPERGKAEERLDLSTLISEALTTNPNIAAAKAAWEARKARIDRVNVLDDPEIGFDTWNIPNDLDLSETRNWIFFARQRFPAAGTLNLRAQAAKMRAEQAKAEISTSVRSIVSAVKIAYNDLYLAHKAIEINEEHIAILKQFEAIAVLKYQTGTTSEQDVLKIRVALSRLENEALRLKRRQHTHQAKLNTLLKRAPHAPLARPEDLQLIRIPDDKGVLILQALAQRPVLKVAEATIRQRQEEVALAKLKFKPDYQVSVKRFQNHSNLRPSGWGISASINLPWFSHQKHDQGIKETRHRTTQQELIYENLKDQTRFEIEDLFVKIKISEQSARLFQDKIIPQAQQSVTSAETGYQTDQVDFLDLLERQRDLVAFRLEYFRALTLQNQEVARLEEVLGSNLSDFKVE